MTWFGASGNISKQLGSSSNTSHSWNVSKGSQSSRSDIAEWRSAWWEDTTDVMPTYTGVSNSSEDMSMYMDYRVAVVLWQCLSPFLLLLGGFGNVATISVLLRMKDSSTQPMFLMALAASDLCLLLSGLFLEVCFYLFDLDLKNLHTVPCVGFMWLSLASNTTSAWLLVTITVQRTLCVTCPTRMRSLFSRRRCRAIIGLVACVSLSLHSHVFYGLHVPNVNPGHCTAVEDYHHFWETMWSWADLCASSLLPSLILLVCNSILIGVLHRRTRAAASLTHATGSNINARRRAVSSTTITVLLLSFAFLGLTLPLYAFVIWSHPLDENSSPELKAEAKLAWTITDLMWYTNSAINFLLYCVSGSKFRRKFLACFRCSEPPPENLSGRHHELEANGRPDNSCPDSRPPGPFFITRL